MRDRIAVLAQSVVSSDPAEVTRALAGLAKSRRILAPIGWSLGTLLLLFHGPRTIVVHWRLTLIELVPALWIGLTWWDLRVHALGNLQPTVLHGMEMVIAATASSASLSSATGGTRSPE